MGAGNENSARASVIDVSATDSNSGSYNETQHQQQQQQQQQQQDPDQKLPLYENHDDEKKMVDSQADETPLKQKSLDVKGASKDGSVFYSLKQIHPLFHLFALAVFIVLCIDIAKLVEFNKTTTEAKRIQPFLYVGVLVIFAKLASEKYINYTALFGIVKRSAIGTFCKKVKDFFCSKFERNSDSTENDCNALGAERKGFFAELKRCLLGTPRFIMKNPLSMTLIVGCYVALGVAAFFMESDEGEIEPPTTIQRFRAMAGIFLIQAGLLLASSNRRAVSARLLASGMLFQIVLGFCLHKVAVTRDFFDAVSKFIKWVLELSKFQGLNSLVEVKSAIKNDTITGYVGGFIGIILPVVVFFCAFCGAMYHLGVIQRVVKSLASVVAVILPVSPAEAVVAVAAPFVGQGECAMIVGPMMDKMTNSEIFAVLTAGFSTIAGGILVLVSSIPYAQVNKPEEFPITSATLIKACILSIPCSLMISKLYMPETETPLSLMKDSDAARKEDEVDVESNKKLLEEEKKEEAPVTKKSLLEATSEGASLGLHIAGLIFANVLVAFTVVYILKYSVAWFIKPLFEKNDIESHLDALPMFLGYLLYPVTFFMGVDIPSLVPVGTLIGTRIFVNEYVAYKSYVNKYYTEITQPYSREITIMALCSFANFGSIAIQVGCLTVLAPSKASNVVKNAFPAMICGCISAIYAACLIGVIY